MFDTLYLIFLFGIIVLLFLNKIERFDTWLLPISILVIALHLVWGLPRWPYIFSYIALILINIKPLIRQVLRKDFPLKRITLYKTLTATLFGITLLILYAFPMVNFPEASGPYQVGTRSDLVTDATRVEIYGERVGQDRMFRIQIWYPTETVEGVEKAPWIEGGRPVSDSLANDWNLPGFLISHLALHESNSYLEAPMVQDLEALPVVIISHGWSGFKNLHTDLAEELASHGYIAISIDHTYGSVATLLENEIALIDGNALPAREETPDFLEYANQLVNTYGNDVITTLNYLEVLNESDALFQSKIDLDNIGVAGHSTGGGGIVSAALNDSRIKALIGFDAWVESLEEVRLIEGLSIPSLFYRSEGWEISFNNEALYMLLENSQQSDLFQINGSTHYDFSMAYMISSLTPFIGLTGDIRGPDFNAILETTMLAFFNSHLSQQELTEPWLEDARIERIEP